MSRPTTPRQTRWIGPLALPRPWHSWAPGLRLVSPRAASLEWRACQRRVVFRGRGREQRHDRGERSLQSAGLSQRSEDNQRGAGLRETRPDGKVTAAGGRKVYLADGQRVVAEAVTRCRGGLRTPGAGSRPLPRGGLARWPGKSGRCRRVQPGDRAVGEAGDAKQPDAKQGRAQKRGRSADPKKEDPKADPKWSMTSSMSMTAPSRSARPPTATPGVPGCGRHLPLPRREAPGAPCVERRGLPGRQGDLPWRGDGAGRGPETEALDAGLSVPGAERQDRLAEPDHPERLVQAGPGPAGWLHDHRRLRRQDRPWRYLAEWQRQREWKRKWERLTRVGKSGAAKAGAAKTGTAKSGKAALPATGYVASGVVTDHAIAANDPELQALFQGGADKLAIQQIAVRTPDKAAKLGPVTEFQKRGSPMIVQVKFIQPVGGDKLPLLHLSPSPVTGPVEALAGISASQELAASPAAAAGGAAAGGGGGGGSAPRQAAASSRPRPFRPPIRLAPPACSNANQPSEIRRTKSGARNSSSGFGFGLRLSPFRIGHTPLACSCCFVPVLFIGARSEPGCPKATTGPADSFAPAATKGPEKKGAKKAE